MARNNSGTAFDPAALRQKYLEERDKRIRPGAAQQYLDAEGEFASLLQDPYVAPGFTRAPRREEVEVAIIGGGFGGLITAAKLRQKNLGPLRIIEQAGDFGGTWYWNRYPGVRCDIESYIYMPLLEEVGTIPTERYATGTEIFAHCQAIGRHYDLYNDALFQTKVTKIAWDDSDRRWIIETNRDDVIAARFVTLSQGPLAKVKLPGIPGIRNFRGKMFHSSRWDYGYTGGDASGGQTGLATERVAIIGTGATAVQIVPKLAAHSKHLYLFQRTPSAIDARNNRPTDLDWFKQLPPGWQQQRLHNFVSVITGKPHTENLVADSWTDFWVRIGKAMAAQHDAQIRLPVEAIIQQVDYEKMEEIRERVGLTIGRAELAEAIKPWYNYLCKRPLFSDDFLTAFNRDNVTLVDTRGRGVEAITENALVYDGEHYQADCIIFATGFDVGAHAYRVGGYQLIGKDSVTLDAKWRKGVRSVHGTQMNGFPNLHIVGGVAQGTTASNFTHTLVTQAAHAVDMIGKCIERGIKAMEVTTDAETRWLAVIERKHVDHDQFYEDCTPGFLNNEGDFRDRPTYVGATYGGGPLEYADIIEAWRHEGWMSDVTTSS